MHAFQVAGLWLLRGNAHERAETSAKRLAARRERPDAGFLASDVMAFSGIDALRDAGIRLPGEVSVVGFDDVCAAAWPSYALQPSANR